MKRPVPYLLLSTALVALCLLACAKQPAPRETTAPKPPEAVQAPEEKHVHEEGAETHEEISLAHKAPEEAQVVANPTTADAASLDHGKKLYAANCAMCHGDKGDGKGPQAIGLKHPPGDFTNKEEMTHHPDGALFWVVTNGGDAMPPFGKKLKEEERWHLINYIRTFAK